MPGSSPSRSPPPIDRALSDWWFEHANRPASGDIIFVDIDGATLEAVGVWPWPRSIHAALIEELLGAGAGYIWLDINFSAAGFPGGDAALADAFAASGRCDYASISYLRNHGIDKLKIDGSFIQQMIEDAEIESIVLAIV
ncbi:CHASE2 domain-containing protein, partial [Pelagibacterium montanilacus]|uniref:CHASE2 domain-containing protein n=1 Tax=Pelagibacterium montanilacus TaxID=2185280 RepID=UPI001FE5D883